MKTHCRKWVWGYCDCLGISYIFRLTTFDVGIRRQKPSNGENRVFHFTLNKGYIGKAIFSSSFSARYHILKKKKKKKKYWVYVAVVLVITLSLLATCPVSSSCSVTHVDGGHLLSAVSMTARIFSALEWETVLFQCITFITFWILDQTSSNLQGSRRKSCQWCVQNYMWSGWELTEISTKDAPPALLQCWLSAVH